MKTISLSLIMLLMCVNVVFATPYNLTDREHHEWIYIGESYGDIYHWRYKGRDNHDHCYLIWLRKELPGRDIVPANGFRKVRYTLYGIDVKAGKYAKYEEVWYTKDGAEYSHEGWDSNWRDIRIPELETIRKELHDRGYK